MTIEYIAFDGKRFQNQGDCEFYEWKCGHTLLDHIEFYDKHKMRIFDYFSESSYIAVTKIKVPDEPSLKQLQDLTDYTGFTSYEDITSPGVWIWNGNNFIKKEGENNINDSNTNENKENKNS